MIIFGSRTKVYVLAMLSLICNACHNPSAHQVLKRQTKFTLFFIPLFPVRPAKYVTQCTYCGQVSNLTKQQVEELMVSSTPAPEVAPPSVPVPNQSESA